MHATSTFEDGFHNVENILSPNLLTYWSSGDIFPNQAAIEINFEVISVEIIGKSRFPRNKNKLGISSKNV